MSEAEALQRPNTVVIADEGSSFLRECLAARLQAMRAATDLIVELASVAAVDYPALHICFQLLVLCVAPKADHLLRHLPPTVTLPWPRKSTSFCWKRSPDFLELRWMTVSAHRHNSTSVAEVLGSVPEC